MTTTGGYSSCNATVDRFYPGSVIGNYLVTLPSSVSASQAQSSVNSYLVLVNIYIPSNFTAFYGISSVSGVDITFTIPGAAGSPTPSANPAGFTISVTLVYAIGAGLGAAVLIALLIASIVVCCQRRHTVQHQKVAPSPGQPPQLQQVPYHPWRPQQVGYPPQAYQLQPQTQPQMYQSNQVVPY